MTKLHHWGRDRIQVPWVAAWTAERPFSIVKDPRLGKKVVHQPHQPGKGVPEFGKPHMVRRRRANLELLCSICGRPTSPGHRWWFPFIWRADEHDDAYLSEEGPVHRACAELSLRDCPHLRKRGIPPVPWPTPDWVFGVVVAGEDLARDFGLPLVGPEDEVIGTIRFGFDKARSTIADADDYARIMRGAGQ